MCRDMFEQDVHSLMNYCNTIDVEPNLYEYFYRDPDLKPFVFSNIFRLLPGNENTIVYNVTRSDNTVITIRIKENIADFFLYNLR